MRDSYIGWLKNFIKDRNNATQNLVDCYTAATLVRRAPSNVKATLLARWTENNIESANKTFLQSAEQILGRSRGRAGMHEVQIAPLARFNSRRVEQPDKALHQWFHNVECDLQISVLTTRGCIRKNGKRIVPGKIVSYNQETGAALHIGVLTSIYVGSRHSAPLDPVYAMCAIRRYRSSRIRQSDKTKSGMMIVSLAGERGELEYVCSTLLQHLYLRVISSEENSFALVRMEQL